VQFLRLKGGIAFPSNNEMQQNTAPPPQMSQRMALPMHMLERPVNLVD